MAVRNGCPSGQGVRFGLDGDDNRISATCVAGTITNALECTNAGRFHDSTQMRCFDRVQVCPSGESYDSATNSCVAGLPADVEDCTALGLIFNDGAACAEDVSGCDAGETLSMDGEQCVAAGTVCLVAQGYHEPSRLCSDAPTSVAECVVLGKLLNAARNACVASRMDCAAGEAAIDGLCAARSQCLRAGAGYDSSGRQCVTTALTPALCQAAVTTAILNGDESSMFAECL